MTEPTPDNSRISATLKGGPGFDAPWVVVRADDASQINDALMDLAATGTYSAVADSAVAFQDAYIKATPSAVAAPAGNPNRPPLTTQAPATTAPVGDEVVLNVPFAEKDAAKALGARWNKDLKAWTVKPRFEPTWQTKFAAYI